LLRVPIKISPLLPLLSHFPGERPSFSVLRPSGSLLLASLSTANSKWRRRPYIIRNPLPPPRRPSSTPSTLGKTARQGWGRRTMASRTPYAASTSRNSTNKLKSRIFHGPKPSRSPRQLYTVYRRAANLPPDDIFRTNLERSPTVPDE
jgi:hypothetical protein